MNLSYKVFEKICLTDRNAELIATNAFIALSPAIDINELRNIFSQSTKARRPIRETDKLLSSDHEISRKADDKSFPFFVRVVSFCLIDLMR